MPEPWEILGLARQAIVAPAGHGKTELIVRAAALGRRTLILTHTHAGVHAIKSRMRRLGISADAVAVDTIASWASRYANAFPVRANSPPATPRNAEWNAVYEGAAAILHSPVVRQVIEASYDQILIDEYQDCESFQHQIALGLSAIIPTVVFGDPMQGIFEFVPSRIHWSTDVGPSFPTAHVLTEPHRWNTANQELGRWIASVRERLMVGEPIDLREGPIQLIESNSAFNMGLFFDGLDERRGSTSAIHCRRPICNSLARATNGAFQSIEEMAAARLITFAQRWENAPHAEEKAAALRALLEECLTRATPDPESQVGPNIEAPLADAWNSLTHFGSAEAALTVIQLERAHPLTRCYRAELLGDAKRALQEIAAGRHSDLVAASEAMRHRLSQSGRSPFARTVSTPLLLKGLEYDNVLIPDATHFLRETAAAKLFYVAISRARQTLSISSSTPILQFPRPNI